MQVVHCELIWMYIPMCPHVGNGCRLSYNLQYLLFIVNSCVGICPCTPVWPIYWVIATAFSTCCPLRTHVYVCTHFPPCGQWFDTKLQPLRLVFHCVLMCQYVPMYPHMASSLSQSWNPQYMMSIVNSWVCMYPCAPMGVMVVDSAIISNTSCSLWTHVLECAPVPQYGQFIES